MTANAVKGLLWSQAREILVQQLQMQSKRGVVYTIPVGPETVTKIVSVVIKNGFIKLILK
jgi:hypothetical protein